MPGLQKGNLKVEYMCSLSARMAHSDWFKFGIHKTAQPGKPCKQVQIKIVPREKPYQQIQIILEVKYMCSLCARMIKSDWFKFGRMQGHKGIIEN